MFIDFIFTWFAICGVIGSVLLFALAGMGVLLLIDVVFKTNFGRRTLRKLITYYEEA